MNNSTKQATDVVVDNNTDESHETQNNKDEFKDWCEEDGEFDVDATQQQNDNVSQLNQHPQTQSPSPPQVSDGGRHNLDDDMSNSGQVLSTNDDSHNDVLGGEKQNEEDDIEDLQHTATKINVDSLHFDEDLEKIGKTNIGNLCDTQNNEVPVQSVLIDQKDVVTLEDEIIKSQSPEKVLKSKQSPQKGKQKKVGRRSKVDTEMLTSSEGVKQSTPNKNKNDQNDDQNDQNDPIDVESDSKTKSGRKVQRPEYFNPAQFGRGRKKSLFDPEDLSNNDEPTRRKRQPGKRKSLKNKSRDTITLQESENMLSDQNSNSPAMYVDEEDSIVCVVCNDGTSIKQNWIVFCDKCDAPYHQKCHKPRIPDNVVDDSQTEWICSKCINLPRSNKRIKVDKTEIQDVHEDKEQAQELISVGTVLTREQKVEYLSSLSQEVLVDLLLLAEQMEPNIPLYPANILGKYASANISSKDNEVEEMNQEVGEGLTDLQTTSTPVAEISNILPDLNPVNIEKMPSQISDQDTQKEPITPESNPPQSNLKEMPDQNKETYLKLYIKAMSELGNPSGSTAQSMHSWIKSNYKVPENFSTRAKKALSYAVSKGIFVKNSRMTYKFNTESSTLNDNTILNVNEPINEEAKVETNVNNNNYEEQKSTYKELSSELQGEEELAGIGKQNSSELNFYQNQEFHFETILDANFLGKGDDTYTATTHSQRSSLSNPISNNAESNKNDDQQPQSPSQLQSISNVSKLPVSSQIIINNEQALRLPPLAPKPTVNNLPSIMRSSSINYQPQQQRITTNQNELLNSSIGGGVIRNNNQTSQPIQMYDNTKIRSPSSSIPSLPNIDNSHNGNKIRMISVHNAPNTISASPQQSWPTSFDQFYLPTQPGDHHFTMFDNSYYDTTSQQSQQHSSTASRNDYVINELQHNDNMYHRISGNQQDNNMIAEWDYRGV